MTFGGQIGFSEILPGRFAKILPFRKDLAIPQSMQKT
jgi:hypothetical protein